MFFFTNMFLLGMMKAAGEPKQLNLRPENQNDELNGAKMLCRSEWDGGAGDNSL